LKARCVVSTHVLRSFGVAGVFVLAPEDSSYELLEEACHEGNQYTLIGQGRIGLKRYQGVTPPQ
jgi:hypothetical protein